MAESKTLTLLFVDASPASIPLGKDTPWGRCVAASVEDVFAERDRLEDAINYALESGWRLGALDGLEWLREWMKGDAEAEADLAKWKAEEDAMLDERAKGGQ